MKKKFAEGGPVEEKTWLEKIGEKLAAKGAPIAYDVADDTAAHEVDGSTNTAKPENDNGTLVGLRNMMKKAKGYDDGGPVIGPQPQEPSFEDKLSQVMQAMGMGAKSALGPLGPTGAIANAVTPPAASAAQSPALPAVANAALGTNLPVPPPTPPPAPIMPPNPPPNAPQAAPAAPAPAPKASTPPPTTATDIMGKLTDGDGAKMSALLAELKDSDKRNQFAQALAVIGDTFGNMGQAKAGQTPSGITTPGMIQGMGQKNKEAALQNLTLSLAADPNSQTSRMAQAALMQSMGMKPGDPRAARIQAMPALAITQLMPQMTDAVKNNIEKEKNLMEAKKADVELSNQELTRENMAATQARESRVAETNAANDTLKNTHFWNVGARNAAVDTLQRNQGAGGGQGHVMTATNKMGHKIVSQDGGKTWKPLQ